MGSICSSSPSLSSTNGALSLGNHEEEKVMKETLRRIKYTGIQSLQDREMVKSVLFYKQDDFSQLTRNMAIDCIYSSSWTSESRISLFKDEQIFNYLWKTADVRCVNTSTAVEMNQSRRTSWCILKNISDEKENALKMFYLVDELMIRSKEESDWVSIDLIYQIIISISCEKENALKMLYLVDELMERSKAIDSCRLLCLRIISNLAHEEENARKMLFVVDDLLVLSETSIHSNCLHEIYMILFFIAGNSSNQSKLASTPGLIDFLFKNCKNGKGEIVAFMSLVSIVGDNEALKHYVDDLGYNDTLISGIFKVIDLILVQKNTSGEWELRDPLQALKNMAFHEKLRKEIAPKVIPMLPKAFKFALDTNDNTSIGYIFKLYSQFAKDPYYETIFQDDPNIRTQIKTVRKIESLRATADELALRLFPNEETVIDAVPISVEINSALVMTVDQVYDWGKSLGGFNDAAELLKKENVDGIELKELYEAGIDGFGYLFKDSKIDKKTIVKFYAKVRALLSTKTAEESVN